LITFIIIIIISINFFIIISIYFIIISYLLYKTIGNKSNTNNTDI